MTEADTIEKAIKYKWHDLRENPDDLPIEGLPVYGYVKRSCFPYEIVYRYQDKYYIQGLDEKEVYIIAWKDIEPFEE